MDFVNGGSFQDEKFILIPQNAAIAYEKWLVINVELLHWMDVMRYQYKEDFRSLTAHHEVA